jgi:bifunctional enzyme CysN/CysC
MLLRNYGEMATCNPSHERPATGSGKPETRNPAPDEQLKIVIVGHVDHGKSTLIGRLFYETGSLPEGKFEQLEASARRRGMPFEWANLTDALQSERDQNVTIDIAQIWFRVNQRQYVLIDAPGHEEFLKNMVTGAASADAALLMIDAHEGVQENSRRHGYLLNLLGVRQIAVLINKMDLVAYAQPKFREIENEYRAFLESIGVVPKVFIPIAAKSGDNLTSTSPNLPWFKGPSVVEVLADFKTAASLRDLPLRFAIQDVYRFTKHRILAGRVESGTLRVGDRLLFSPSHRVSTVKSIERWSAPARDSASAGESIGITLTGKIFVERGAIAALPASPPYELACFKTRIFWLGRQPFRLGRKYKLKLATQEVECEIASLDRIIDASTLATVSRAPDQAFVGRHEVAELTLKTNRPVAFDVASDIVATSRFVIVDGCDIAGGGVIIADQYPRRSDDSSHKSENIFWTEGKVSNTQREQRNGHVGCVVWLTGLSGSGKSTIATELERELFTLGRHAYVLDGDKVRHGLASDLGFSPADRKENIRRVGEVAKLFADAGFICITSFISPYRSDRELARKIAPRGKFLEVYLNVPLEVCEQRDTKGLYAKARAGEIKEFTGISAPYEPPVKPEIELHTDKLTVTDCVAAILESLSALKVDSHQNRINTEPAT